MPALAIICLAASSRLRAAPADSLPPYVGTPVPSAAASSFMDSLVVALATETEGAKIYYTLDGSTPTEWGAIYTGPIVIRATATLKAVAVKEGLRTSAVSVTDYVKVARLEKPICTPAPGYFAGDSLLVVLASPSPAAVIRYSLDGSDPTVSGVVYSGPILITSSVTLRAVAVANGYAASAVMTSEYTFVKGAGVRETAAVRASRERGGPRDAMGRARSGRAVPLAVYLPLGR